MANTGYRQRQQLNIIGSDPFWFLLFVVMALALALAGLPWIIIGFVAQRYLARWLHWKVSFLLWAVLLFLAWFAISQSYQHGLKALFDREVFDYTRAAVRHQWDFLSYPLRQLWSDTWPVWLRTWQSIGIAGFVAELVANRNDTVRSLRDNERRRQRRVERFQNRARQRTRRPAFIPDEVSGDMVIGVPIQDDEEE